MRKGNEMACLPLPGGYERHETDYRHGEYQRQRSLMFRSSLEGRLDKKLEAAHERGAVPGIRKNTREIRTYIAYKASRAPDLLSL